MNYINHHIIVKESGISGKGVFTKSALSANTLLEVAPVIVLSIKDTKLIHQTRLHDYYFTWGESQDKSAIALGYVSLYNHSEKNNCYHECDFENNTISIFTKQEIEKNEELLIDYTMGEDKDLWFTAQ